MKVSFMYSKLAKKAIATATVAVFAALAVSALMLSTVHARPHYIQDVQYLQVAPQMVINQPRLVVQTPMRPVHVAPVHTRPVVVHQIANHPRKFVSGRIYYINGLPYLNGHPYVRGHAYAYGHYKTKHLKRHHDRYDRFDRHDVRHDQGRHVGPHH
jgi:hypothetical protein